jgi:hypothetical protein
MLRDSAYPSRRMLLAGLGAGVVGAIGAAASAAPVLRLAAPTRTTPSLQAGGLAEWTATVGEKFTLTTANGSHTLKVVSATAFPASGTRPPTLTRTEAFSVLFELVGGPQLPSGDSPLYQLTHRTYAPLPIYLSAPIAFGLGTRVAAVFN